MSAPNTINVRLQLGNISDPTVGPVDINTGRPPQIWRGSTLKLDLGIFAAAGVAVDLSELAFLEVDIFPAAILNISPGTNFTYNPYSVTPFPNLPPAPLEFVTIPADQLTDVISLDEWRAGNAQQATAVFDWINTLALQLNGKNSADFWLVVQGVKPDNTRLIYGGTTLTVFETGAQGIYLPNDVAPILVPADTILYIAPNQQLTYSETIDVEGTIIIDGGMLIQV